MVGKIVEALFGTALLGLGGYWIYLVISSYWSWRTREYDSPGEGLGIVWTPWAILAGLLIVALGLWLIFTRVGPDSQQGNKEEN